MKLIPIIWTAGIIGCSGAICSFLPSFSSRSNISKEIGKVNFEEACLVFKDPDPSNKKLALKEDKVAFFMSSDKSCRNGYLRPRYWKSKNVKAEFEENCKAVELNSSANSVVKNDKWNKCFEWIKGLSYETTVW